MINVKERLYKTVASVVAVDEDQFVPEASLVNDFNTDSFDLIRIAMNIEEEFSITIPTDAMSNLRTVQDLLDYVGERN